MCRRFNSVSGHQRSQALTEAPRLGVLLCANLVPIPIGISGGGHLVTQPLDPPQETFKMGAPPKYSTCPIPPDTDRAKATPSVPTHVEIEISQSPAKRRGLRGPFGSVCRTQSARVPFILNLQAMRAGIRKAGSLKNRCGHFLSQLLR